MDVTVIPAEEAKTKFLELVKRAKSGESFLVTLDGREAARLSPLNERASEEQVNALFDRIDNVRKGTVLNPKGQEKLTIRGLIEEGRR